MCFPTRNVQYLYQSQRAEQNHSTKDICILYAFEHTLSVDLESISKGGGVMLLRQVLATTKDFSRTRGYCGPYSPTPIGRRWSLYQAAYIGDVTVLPVLHAFHPTSLYVCSLHIDIHNSIPFS
jgi:hypothetical protein